MIDLPMYSLRQTISLSAVTAMLTLTLVSGRAAATGLAAPGAHGPRPPDSLLCDPAAWPLPVDGALCDAAKRIAVLLDEDAAAAPASPSSFSFAREIRRALFEAGVVDPHVRVRRVTGSTYGSLFLSMEAAVADGAADTSHIGLGLAPGGDGQASAVVLLARRLVHVEPFPSSMAPGEVFTLRGRLSAESSAPAFWLGIDSGPVLPIQAELEAGAFQFQLGPLPPGRHFVEILVEAGEGPEVALLAPIRVGAPPLEEPAALIVDGEVDHAAAVHQAISDYRRLRQLQAADRDLDLDRLAKIRAESIASRGRPVHRQGPDEDAAAGLALLGYAFSWAGENLATGPGTADAYQGIMESPAHRRLLEHPRARRVGVGIHVEGERTWLAILLAEPMDSRSRVPFATAERVIESRLLHRAEDALREARRGRGLAAMTRDPALDSLAGGLARQLAERDLPSDPLAQAETRRSALAAVPFATAVSLEVVVGGRPEDLARAPSVVEDDCDRLGLGVASAASRRFGGERLWLAAICIHRGADR